MTSLAVLALATSLVAASQPERPSGGEDVATADDVIEVAGEDVESGPEATAVAEARSSGKRVEVEELRTETSQVFANPSGTMTLEQYALPVRVEQDDEWVDVDTTLEVKADGSVGPVATVGSLRLSGGGDTEMVRIGDPEGEHVLLEWPEPLPEPTLEGSTATYPEVLPGVDLLVRADVEGFSQLLVVKDRKAAASQQLRRLDYPITAADLELEVTDDGTTLATDDDGTPVFVIGSPMMWDSSAAPEGTDRSDQAASASSKPVDMEVDLVAEKGGQALVIEPDADMLAAPDTQFPVFIDPSVTPYQYRWTHVNKTFPNQSYWNYDRNQGAKVGYSSWESPIVTYRSLFQMNTTPINGSIVKSARFYITLAHSASCSATPVELWHTRPIDPAQALTWGNSVEGHWLGGLAWASGNANKGSCGQPDMSMEFGSAALNNLVQNAATNRTGYVTLGLKAPNEGDRNLWKRFHPNTARVTIEYNNRPRVPSYLNFRRPLPCGTAADPTPIGTDQPQFSGVASDPDNHNVRTQLQIHGPNGALAYSVWSATTTSQAAFSWPELPAGRLQDGLTYSVRAYSNDGSDDGPATSPCYFTVDTKPPGVPRIESADYPDGVQVIPARTTGTVRFLPAAGETDVAEYVYGFQQLKITLRVKAKADGTAEVPITVSERFGRSLYVEAVDRAGNVSSTRPAWDLEVEQNPDEPAKVPGDVTGDGRPDVTAVLDQGFGRTAVWNIVAGDEGFYPGTIAWDSDVNGGFPLFRVRPVTGDFDGDGRTDMALFREGAGRAVSLYPLVSDGNRYDAQPAVWTSPAPGWSLNTVRFDTGDVDGDGRDDIIAQLWKPDDTREILVFPGANLSSPKVWLTEDVSRADPSHQVAPLVADIDGDGSADLVSTRAKASCQTVFELNRSTGSGFESTASVLRDSGNEFCWPRAKFTVADVDGDGLDDIVAPYEYNLDDVGLWTFRSTGTELTASLGWRGGGEFDLGKSTLTAGDFNLDGKDDLAVLYACCQEGDRQVWTFESTGTDLGTKTVSWHEPTDAVAGPAYYLEHRSYEMVARHSRKCVSVSGASTANMAWFIQWPCRGWQMNERYRLIPVAGTDRYQIRAIHSQKCADLLNATHNDGQQVVQNDCNGNAHQQVTLEYIDGSSYDTVVRLRFAHSGKCLNVHGGSTADGTALAQQTCGGAASQQWTLQPSSNPQLDGRFKIHAQVSNGYVLDVQDCNDKDIRIWHWVSGSPCQKWQVTSHGDDLYRILDPDSGKSLDIQGCSDADLAEIELGVTNDSRCQVWRIEPSAGGTYSVLSPTTGKSLDVAGCSSAAGANVIIWPYWGGACQRWHFDKQ